MTLAFEHAPPWRRQAAAPSATDNTAVDTRPLVLVNHLVEPPGRITGITRYAFGLLDALLDRGTWRYALASGFKREQLPASIADRLDGVLTFPRVESTPLNYMRQHTMLNRAVRETGASLVYAVNSMCPAVRGVPNIVTAHDLYMKTLPHMYDLRHRIWWSLFFSHAGRSASAIACVSHNTQADVQRFYPALAGKTRLVNCAAVMPHPAHRTTLPPSMEQPYILLLGNLTPNKNAGYLIAALKRLRATGAPVAAWHVGRDPYGALADADGLIAPLGGVDDAQLDAIVGGARALVACSTYEGFGLPLIEAHERDTPVIATDIPIFREVAGDAALFVRLDDVGGFADAIGSLMTDDSLYADLQARARHNALRYSWAHSAEAAEAMIAEFIPARRA